MEIRPVGCVRGLKCSVGLCQLCTAVERGLLSWGKFKKKKRSTFGPSSFKARRCRGLSSFFGLQKHPSVLVLWFGVCLWEKSRYSRLFHRGKSSTSTSSSGQIQLHLNINTTYLSVSNMLVYLLLIDSIQFGNFSLCESWNVGTRLWFVWVFVFFFRKSLGKFPDWGQ